MHLFISTKNAMLIIATEFSRCALWNTVPSEEVIKRFISSKIAQRNASAVWDESAGGTENRHTWKSTWLTALCSDLAAFEGDARYSVVHSERHCRSHPICVSWVPHFWYKWKTEQGFEKISAPVGRKLCELEQPTSQSWFHRSVII